MKRRSATQPESSPDDPRTHLLVAVNARVPASLASRGEDYETTMLRLAGTPLAELASYTEQVWSRVSVVLPGWPHLRLFLLPSRLLGLTADLVIHMTQDVARTAQPSLAPLLDRGISIHWAEGSDSSVELSLAADKPLALLEMMRCIVGRDSGPLHVPLRVAVDDRDIEPFVVGSPHARYTGVDDYLMSAGNNLSTVDLALEATGDPTQLGQVAATEGTRPVVRVLGGADFPQDDATLATVDPVLALPPVDTSAMNPAGFTVAKRKSAVTAIAADEGSSGLLLVDDQVRVVVRVNERGLLTRKNLQRLRPFSFVRVTPSAFTGAIQHAWLVTQLAAAGVPIISAPPPPAVARLLGPELVAALRQVTPAVVADPLLREVASVSLRRAALRNHAPGARARKLAALAGLPLPSQPLVSVILVTRRPSFLASALSQVAPQTWGNLELVLGLHGDDFDDEAVDKALADFPRPVAVVRIPASESFGQALNRTTAAAQGEYITKWDDDDYYGADHVWDLLLAADYSGADVVGKGSEYIQLDALGDTVGGRNSVNERRVRFVAGGTMLLRRQTLADLGGWRPVPFAVDQALLRMVLDAGGTIYRTHGLEYILRRHAEGHTWHAETRYFLERQTRRWPSSAWRQQVVLTTDLSLRPPDGPSEELVTPEHG